MIHGSTRVFAVLGDPVGHSLSPVMYNAAFQALGIDAVSVALRVSAADLPGLIGSLARAGGGGNVTIPHKRLAATIVFGPNPRPPILNTFWGEGGAVRGANTDPDGVVAGWKALGQPAGDWLIVGTGGSAVAVAMAAGRLDIGIAVRSRDPDRAATFVDRATTHGVRRAEPDQIGLVLNCTPLGLNDSDDLPLAIADMPAGAAALDLVYRSGETAWVRAARAQGRPAADGREVLLGQATVAFGHWYPAAPAPGEVMRAALARALR